MQNVAKLGFIPQSAMLFPNPIHGLFYVLKLLFLVYIST